MRHLPQFIAQLKTQIGWQKKIPSPSTHLQVDQLSVYQSCWEQVQNDTDLLIERYLQENGNILDADRAKELFPLFTESRQTRIRHLTAVYEPAQQLIDLIYNRKLQSADKDALVIFTAGGPACGKSSLVESIRETIQTAHLTMDGTLSDLSRAIKNINLALNANCLVAVFFVYRHFPDAVEGAIQRALSSESFRPVPVRIVAGKYFGALHTTSTLYAEFRQNPRVIFRFKHFKKIGAPLAEWSIGELNRNLPKRLALLEKTGKLILHDRYLKAQRNNQSFPPEIYEALASKAPSFRGPRG